MRRLKDVLRPEEEHEEWRGDDELRYKKLCEDKTSARVEGRIEGAQKRTCNSLKLLKSELCGYSVQAIHK